MNNWYKTALTNNNQSQITKIIIQQVFPQIKSTIQSKMKIGQSGFYQENKIKLFIGYNFISSGYINCKITVGSQTVVNRDKNKKHEHMYSSSGGVIFGDNFVNNKAKDKDLSNNIKQIYFNMFIKTIVDENYKIITKTDYRQIYFNLLRTISHQVKHIYQVYNDPDKLRSEVTNNMKIQNENESYRNSIFQPFISSFTTNTQPYQVQATVKGVYENVLKSRKINKISYKDFREIIQRYVYNQRLNVPGLLRYIGGVSDEQKRIINKKAQQMTDIYMEYAQNNLGLL